MILTMSPARIASDFERMATTTCLHSALPQQFPTSIAVPAVSTAVPAVASTGWPVIFAIFLRLQLCQHNPFLHSVLLGRGPCRLLCAACVRCPAILNSWAMIRTGWPRTT